MHLDIFLVLMLFSIISLITAAMIDIKMYINVSLENSVYPLPYVSGNSATAVDF